MSNEGNIHLAMAAIMQKMEGIEKDRKNQAQGFNFRGIDDVYNALHPIFREHGVTCVPFVHAVDGTTGVNSKGSSWFRTLVTMGFRFTASDGSFVEARTIGEGIDYGDKSCAKALSVAHKYLLLQTFLIPTEEIVDGDDYSPTIDARAEIFAAKEQKAHEAAMRAKDIASMRAIINQYEEEMATSTPERRQHLQGLKNELVCKIADLALEGAPVEVVPVAVSSPAPTPSEATQEKKSTRGRPKKQPEPQAPERWQDHIISVENKMIKGKRLADLFNPEKEKEALEKNYNWFYKNFSGSQNPAEIHLLELVESAFSESIKTAKEAQQTPIQPSAAPEPENAATEPPRAEKPAFTGWRAFTIESASPEWDKKQLGELTAEQIRFLHEEKLAAVSCAAMESKPKLKQWKANVALGYAELCEPEPKHITDLKAKLKASDISEQEFLDNCKMAQWTKADSIEGFTQTEAERLLSDWRTVEDFVKGK